MQENEVAKIEIKKYADFTMENLKKGLVKEIQVDDSTSYLGFYTMRPELCYLLSTKNLICVGDTIYQYNENNIKKIPNRDFSKISNLQNTKQTLSDNSVIVEYVPTNSKGHVIRYFSTPLVSYSGDNKKKFTLYIYYIQGTSQSGGNTFATTIYAQMTYHKYVWGKWRYRNTDFTFKASTYYMKATLPNGTSYTQTEYPSQRMYYNRGNAKHYYMTNGYGGDLSQFIHTPHVSWGKLGFYVKAGWTVNWGLSERYGLK